MTERVQWPPIKCVGSTLVFNIRPCMAVTFILQNRSLSYFWILKPTTIYVQTIA
jgi:hypothetical protein